MADAGFGSDLHRRAHVLRADADDLTGAMLALCTLTACKVCTGCAHGGSRPCAGTVRCPTTGAVSRCQHAPVKP